MFGEKFLVTFQPHAVIFVGKGGCCADSTLDFKASTKTYTGLCPRILRVRLMVMKVA